MSRVAYMPFRKFRNIPYYLQNIYIFIFLCIREHGIGLRWTTALIQLINSWYALCFSECVSYTAYNLLIQSWFTATAGVPGLRNIAEIDLYSIIVNIYWVPSKSGGYKYQAFLMTNLILLDKTKRSNSYIMSILNAF